METKHAYIMKLAHTIAKRLEGDYLARLAEGLRLAHASFKVQAIDAGSAKIEDIDPNHDTKGTAFDFSGVYVPTLEKSFQKADDQQELELLVSALRNEYGSGFLLKMPGKYNGRFDYILK